MHSHRWSRARLAALTVALFALAVPGSALAGHDLTVYKAEKQVDMDSDEVTVDLGCKSGDHVLDGMWRVDHADLDHDDNWITAIARAVDVTTATPIDGSTYRFHFVKQAIGRAQLKVFVTCLASETSKDRGHQHPIVVTDFFNQTQTQWNNTAITPDWDWDPANGETACPAGSWAISPGFEFTAPAWDEMEAGSFRPYQSEYASYRMQNWTWAFQFPASGGTVNLRMRCLRMRVTAAGTPAESHRLVTRYQQFSPTIRGRRVDEGQAICGEMYKAMVSGFAIDPSFVGPGLNDWRTTKLWYLGMDPRLKSRSLRILGSGRDKQPIDTRTLCLNYRTT